MRDNTNGNIISNDILWRLYIMKNINDIIDKIEDTETDIEDILYEIYDMSNDFLDGFYFEEECRCEEDINNEYVDDEDEYEDEDEYDDDEYEDDDVDEESDESPHGHAVTLGKEVLDEYGDREDFHPIEVCGVIGDDGQHHSVVMFREEMKPVDVMLYLMDAYRRAMENYVDSIR